MGVVRLSQALQPFGLSGAHRGAGHFPALGSGVQTEPTRVGPSFRLWLRFWGPWSPPSRIFVELLLRGVPRQAPDSLPPSRSPPFTPSLGSVLSPALPGLCPCSGSGGDVAGVSPLFLSSHSCSLSL